MLAPPDTDDWLLLENDEGKLVGGKYFSIQCYRWLYVISPCKHQIKLNSLWPHCWLIFLWITHFPVSTFKGETLMKHELWVYHTSGLGSSFCLYKEFLKVTQDSFFFLKIVGRNNRAMVVMTYCSLQWGYINNTSVSLLLQCSLSLWHSSGL